MDFKQIEETEEFQHLEELEKLSAHDKALLACDKIANLTIPCVMCQKEIKLDVPLEDFKAWRSGTLIQDAMPYLTACQREMLITKICVKCNQNLF